VTTEKFSAQQVLVLAPGVGQVIPARPESSFVTVKVGGPFLQCPITVAEGHFNPSQGAPECTSPHRHHQFTQMTYVLEGEMTFLIGEELHHMEAGAFICIPPEVIHTYVPSRASMTRLLIDVPRFQIESNLMEIVQVLYRGRGEQAIDLGEKEVTFYLTDRILAPEGAREGRCAKASWAY
jgi:mannose-6-phosphate isomerase-like protein (cupin superfamily)